jgi:hypothetical protein
MKLTPSSCEGMAGCGPLVSLNDGFACGGRRGKGACGQAATLHWSGLRFAATALRCSVSWPRRRTHSARFALFAQTTATSQTTKRASRAATSPALLGAPEARRNLPARAFADTAAVFPTNATAGGLRGGRCPAGAIWVATSSAGPGSARASAPRHLTRRGCLNAANAVSAVSSAARPRTEQRSAVDAQRRPPPNEPPPGSARRDAPTCRRRQHLRTSATGRKQTPKTNAAFHASRKALCAMGH